MNNLDMEMLWPEQMEEVAAPEMAHRLTVVEALLEASHLLLMGEGEHLYDVLEVTGLALEARQLAVTVQTAAGQDELVEWWRDGAPSEGRTAEHARDEGGAEPEAPMEANDRPHGRETDRSLSFPIVSTNGKLLGSLYYGYDGLSEEEVGANARILSILSNLLAGFLERKMKVQSLRKSKEQYVSLVHDHPLPVLVTSGPEILIVNQAGAELLGVPIAELTGRSFLDFVPATDFEMLEERWAAVLGGEQVPALRHDLIRRSGEERIVESISLPFSSDGTPLVQTVLRDVTEAWRSEERYRAFLETTSQAFWHLQLDVALPKGLSLDEQVEHVWRHARIAECSDEFAALVGTDDIRSIRGRRLAVVLRRSGRDLVAAFVRQGYTFQHKEYVVNVGTEQAQHVVINAVSSGTRNSALLHVWGTCIDMTKQVQLERRMVVALENQQEQFARDLHDGVGQLLTGIRMLASNLLDRHFGPDEPSHRQAQKVVQYAEEASRSVRELYQGLAPRQLVHDGLLGALDELTVTIGGLDVLKVKLLHDGTFDVVQREAKLQLYRITQEAANNALKYSQAEHLWIQVLLEGDHVVLQVEDDGVGFRVDQEQTSSLGLYSMQYRARSLGGTLAIESAPGEGTVVRCQIPAADIVEYV